MGHRIATGAVRDPEAPASPANAAAPKPHRDLRPIYAGILVWMGVFGLIWLLE